MSKQTSTPTYKNVLFLVTGMTPQIVTETVWALACDPDNPDKWVPDEIHIFSTEQGFNQIKKRLFTEGVFAQMQKDYPQLQNTRFDERFFHYITQSDEVLPDVTTPEHNQVMANSLCETIRTLCQDKNSNLHVSLAGGRKTMGFYAGYALSLYGRVQDSLSHVLIDPQYEKASDFFYPTIQEYLISDRDGKVLNAQEAEIWLSKIPFVRMRNLIDKKSIMQTKTFSEVVSLIDMSIQPITLKIIDDFHDVRTIMINDIKCKLSPKEFAIYMLFTKLKQANKSLKYPVKKGKDKNDTSIYIDAENLSIYNENYGIHKVEPLLNKEFDHDYLRDGLTNIRRKFRKTFGKSVTDKIMICETEQQGYYAIPLEKEQIIIQA